MKKYVLTLVFLVLVSLWSVGQIDVLRKKVEDAGAASQGLYTLRFYNAVNGAPVAYSNIILQSSETIISDKEGTVKIEIKPDGIYPFRFEKQGFITEDFQMEFNSGKIRYNRYIVSPLLKSDALRIVLTWENKPEDLDAHLVKGEDFRISSRDLQVSADGHVILECESSGGYGPETILIRQIDLNAEYSFIVTDFTNKDTKSSTAISGSNAKVKIYYDEKLQYQFQPSKKQTGNVWMVFTIKNGQVNPTDESRTL